MILKTLFLFFFFTLPANVAFDAAPSRKNIYIFLLFITNHENNVKLLVEEQQMHERSIESIALLSQLLFFFFFCKYAKKKVYLLTGWGKAPSAVTASIVNTPSGLSRKKEKWENNKNGKRKWTHSGHIPVVRTADRVDEWRRCKRRRKQTPTVKLMFCFLRYIYLRINLKGIFFTAMYAAKSFAVSVLPIAATSYRIKRI